MRRRAPAPPAASLRPLVELLEAADDSIYLLCGPADRDYVIRDPTPEVREIIRALRRPRSARAVMTCCRSAGVDVSAEAVHETMSALASEGLLETIEPADAARLVAGDRVRFDRQMLYLRQMALPAASGEALQLRLRRASVVIIGCGGLGSWAAWSVACLGVGSVTLVDFDVVELTNLNRQLLFTPADVGRHKCDAAAERLRAFDPALRVVALRDRIAGADDVARIVAGADVVLACADWPPYDISRWIDEGCRAAAVPHVSAGQLPPLSRVGPFVVPGVTPCVGCFERGLRAATPLYDELETMRKHEPRPAATLGPACGLIGSILAFDVLGWLTGLHTPSTWSQAISIDMRTMQPEVTPVSADARCGCGASGSDARARGPG